VSTEIVLSRPYLVCHITSAVRALEHPLRFEFGPMYGDFMAFEVSSKSSGITAGGSVDVHSASEATIVFSIDMSRSLAWSGEDQVTA
jgi:hypothetical protein